MKRYFLSVDGMKSIYMIDDLLNTYAAYSGYGFRETGNTPENIMFYEHEGLVIAIEEPEAMSTIERWRKEQAA